MIKEYAIETILEAISLKYAGAGSMMDKFIELGIGILNETYNIPEGKINYFIEEYVYKTLNSRWVMVMYRDNFEIFQQIRDNSLTKLVAEIEKEIANNE